MSRDAGTNPSTDTWRDPSAGLRTGRSTDPSAGLRTGRSTDPSAELGTKPGTDPRGRPGTEPGSGGRRHRVDHWCVVAALILMVAVMIARLGAELAHGPGRARPAPAELVIRTP